MSDTYFTIERNAEGKYTEKMSRFLGFSFRVSNAEEAREIIKKHQNLYHDARHICWAYIIGPDKKEWQLNDNGEPSGTAGKPILGQIRSFDLTNVLVLVVRYFGGIKLGTPGLIKAYREAARLTLEESGRIEMHEMTEYSITFPYLSMEAVMKIIKSEEITILEKDFNQLCRISLRFRKDITDKVVQRLSGVEGLTSEMTEFP